MNLFYFISFISLILTSSLAFQTPIYNGDIYMMNEEKFLHNRKNLISVLNFPESTTISASMKDTDAVDFNNILEECNSSFSIPTGYLTTFNSTGSLPDEMDKTGMCFLRCFYEKSDLITNWKLNGDKIRKYMWPATGDSVEVCEQEKSKEPNACVRLYAIAKCLMLRAIVDARNKPV
uniref:Odorant-binding protein 84a n=1 Tax=Glossina brevipalpis TaxID=37001 RepID=A0A1A9WL95_9MUSC